MRLPTVHFLILVAEEKNNFWLVLQKFASVQGQLLGDFSGLLVKCCTDEEEAKDVKAQDITSHLEGVVILP